MNPRRREANSIQEQVKHDRPIQTHAVPYLKKEQETNRN